MRRSISILLSFMFALLVIGCANRHEVAQFGSLTVHTFRLEYANTHLLVQGDGLVMVDTGLERNAARLEAELHDAGFDPKRIRAVVLTHGHADHAGGARYFKEHFGTRILAGAGDRTMINTGKMDHLCPTDAIARMRLNEDQTQTYAATTGDVWIDKPQSLAEIGGIDGTIVPMAGHTPGSLVVLTPQAAFVGDLFRGSIIDASAERHFYMCNEVDNDQDIRALLGLGPAITTFFPGHFGPVDRLAVEMRFLSGS